jgi:aryl-alcohol dehydrogenase-like predicted oxidoreductase
MSRTNELETLVDGRATATGTRGFARKFASIRGKGFYRQLPDGRSISSLGLGSYLGECDDAEDRRYCATVLAALDRGVNFIDTAINYRCQRSERCIGEALRQAMDRTGLTREEFVVCSKGGYVPLDRTPPATKEGYRGFLQSEYYGRGVMSAEDVVSGGHCLTPRYIADQIERSRRNLGLACIDIYYLHNPEQQLDVLPRPQFLDVLRAAFAELEEHVDRGVIGAYGCSTWSGLRVPPDARNYLSLAELVGLAVEVGGNAHHFGIVQLPINLAMMEAVRVRNQDVQGERISALEAAARLGVGVVGSASLMQGQLARSLPEQVRLTIPGFSTDARRALAFAQSLPVLSSLVGMKSIAHLEENLEAPVN